MPKINVPDLVVSPRKQETVAAPAGSPDRLNMNEHFFNAQCLSCGGPASQSNPEFAVIIMLTFNYVRHLSRLLYGEPRNCKQPGIPYKSARETFSQRPPNLRDVHQFFSRGSNLMWIARLSLVLFQAKSWRSHEPCTHFRSAVRWPREGDGKWSRREREMWCRFFHAWLNDIIIKQYLVSQKDSKFMRPDVAN